MSEWTPSAKATLDHYFRRVRASIESDGADAGEVIDDLRRHLDQEAMAEGLNVVTEPDVHRLLKRIGAPEPTCQPIPARNPVITPPPEPPTIRPSIWILVFGVGLPALTFGFEWATAFCAEALFDPMPTVWHELLVLLVPVANGLAWWACAQRKTEWSRSLGWANGLALGIALFYTLQFLPITPHSLIVLCFFGAGFIPLTPLCSLLATATLRRHLRRLHGSGTGSFPGVWGGLAAGFTLLFLLELPDTITRIARQSAISDDPVSRKRGIDWLRRIASENTLLRDCYGRSRWAEGIDLISLILREEKVSVADARLIYYRVTGRTFNSVPPPSIRTARGRWNGLDEFTWDPDQGGTSVGGRLKGVSLVQSRLDGVIYPDAALGYLEWTLEFKNTTPRQREARAQIQLPPESVVSRLTLWVNGEEREAAFGGRSQVRQAYEAVVQRRRDPVLVTTCGPDRVLMQCFPVPPDGGTIKVRLGITAPLHLSRTGPARWAWPAFLERNFQIPTDLKHAVWLESTAAITNPTGLLKPSQPKPDYFNLAGSLSESELAQGGATALSPIASPPPTVWTPASAAFGLICQRLAEDTSQPSHIVVVVDGSSGSAPEYPGIASALNRLPEATPFTLILANDTPQVLSSTRTATGAARQLHGQALLRARPTGGQDNVPALLQAWDIAMTETNGLIVWIHGPQPAGIGAVEILRQRFERRARSPRILDVQTRPGPDHILQQLEDVAHLEFMPRFGALADDLGRLLEGMRAGQEPPSLARLKFEADQMHDAPRLSEPAARHLERLWGREEVRRLIRKGKSGLALDLSIRLQLVTPVCGAVVLETQQQFEAAGLKPVDAATVPAVPEPRILGLLILGFVLLGLQARLRRAP